MNAAERTAAIKEATDSDREAARTGDPIPTQRLWCKDDWKDFPIYDVSVDSLVLNIDNRRFAAERRLLEERLGHPLDPENNPNDEMSVISILLDTGHKVDGEVVKGTETKDAAWRRQIADRH